MKLHCISSRSFSSTSTIGSTSLSETPFTVASLSSSHNNSQNVGSFDIERGTMSDEIAHLKEAQNSLEKLERKWGRKANIPRSLRKDLAQVIISISNLELGGKGEGGTDCGVGVVNNGLVGANVHSKGGGGGVSCRDAKIKRVGACSVPVTSSGVASHDSDLQPAVEMTDRLHTRLMELRKGGCSYTSKELNQKDNRAGFEFGDCVRTWKKGKWDFRFKEERGFVVGTTKEKVYVAFEPIMANDVRITRLNNFSIVHHLIACDERPKRYL